MMSNNDSEDDTGLRTPMVLRKGSRCSRSTPDTPSSISSSVVFGPIPDEVLRVWSQLPEAIRLDPSLAVFQKEYDRLHHVDGNSKDAVKRDCLVVNMSVGKQPMPLKKHYQEVDEEDHDAQHEVKPQPCYRYLKLVLLTLCWMIFTLILMYESEEVDLFQQVSVPNSSVLTYILSEPGRQELTVTLRSSILAPNGAKSNVFSEHLKLWLELVYNDKNNISLSQDNIIYTHILNETWILPLLPESLDDVFPIQTFEKTFDLGNVDKDIFNHGAVAINFQTNASYNLPISIYYKFSSTNNIDNIVYAALILLGLYILIIFEVVHRALAAMLASTMSVAVLAAVKERPSMAELFSWIDVDTLLLLFSMMILVAIVAETGIFDWMAVYAYKITEGKLWPLVNTLCFFTAFVSSLLDNVTTVLLMTPVTIRLCEVMELNPVPILTAMVVYSNIGGAMTPVGDPPNVIIASNRDVINAGVDFSTFAMHMSIGVILVVIVVYAQLRFIFRNASVLRFDEPQEVQELRHEIAIWQRAAASLSSYSKDENLVRETLLKKVQRLLTQLKKKKITGSVALEKYKATLEELQEKYPIRDKWLLAKSGFALGFVITLFFLHSLPNLNLSLGWSALLGVILLLILADSEDLDGLMARVEWSTLLFFASLFILMEALSRLGLIAWIGKLTEKLILSVDEDSRLACAILLLLWVSALASAFVDNVPLTTMMVRIATSLADNHELRLPLQPLVWALAFGACMGVPTGAYFFEWTGAVFTGNGTLIGATANVVCAGVAEQHGYKFTFMQFLKVGFPVMITSTMTVTMYLILAHVVFNWNGVS